MRLTVNRSPSASDSLDCCIAQYKLFSNLLSPLKNAKRSLFWMFPWRLTCFLRIWFGSWQGMISDPNTHDGYRSICLYVSFEPRYVPILARDWMMYVASTTQHFVSFTEFYSSRVICWGIGYLVSVLRHYYTSWVYIGHDVTVLLYHCHDIIRSWSRDELLLFAATY